MRSDDLHNTAMEGEGGNDRGETSLPLPLSPITEFAQPTYTKPDLSHIFVTPLDLEKGKPMERKVIQGQLNVANWLQILAQSPSIIGKIVSLLTSIKAKDYATTTVGLTALLTNLAGLVGYTIDPQFVAVVNGIALSIVGYFTGKEKLGS